MDQRTLPDNRDRLREELEEAGLRSNDRYEFICRTHGLCGDITMENQLARYRVFHTQTRNR